MPGVLRQVVPRDPGFCVKGKFSGLGTPYAKEPLMPGNPLYLGTFI